MRERDCVFFDCLLKCLVSLGFFKQANRFALKANSISERTAIDDRGNRLLPPICCFRHGKATAKPVFTQNLVRTDGAEP